MGTYAAVVTVILLILAAFSGWNSVQAFRRSRGEEDKALHKAANRKCLSWLSLGLMLLFAALYILFRAGWLMLVASLMAWMAIGSVIGSGLGENMKKH